MVGSFKHHSCRINELTVSIPGTVFECVAGRLLAVKLD